MNELHINPEWNFRETVQHIEALKLQYCRTLTLFSCFFPEQKTEYIRKTKRQVYVLKFEEWKRDKIWAFMNDYEDFLILLKFI